MIQFPVKQPSTMEHGLQSDRCWITDMVIDQLSMETKFITQAELILSKFVKIRLKLKSIFRHFEKWTIKNEEIEIEQLEETLNHYRRSPESFIVNSDFCNQFHLLNKYFNKMYIQGVCTALHTMQLFMFFSQELKFMFIFAKLYPKLNVKKYL